MVINKKSRGRKTGFTLVELLAVIVILAIILVIAVPKVMSVIEDAKKATLESTAKMIASQAEKQKVQNTVLGNNDAITCASIAQINNVDYKSCNIEFVGNIAHVTIKGDGKFGGLSVCEGTKTNSIATKDGCGLVSLTVDLAGGTDNVDYESAYEPESEVTLVDPTREGYSFMGWSVTGNDSRIIDGKLIIGTSSTKVTALWEEYSEDYPTLLSGPTIYQAIDGTGLKDYIVEFEFVDTYVLTGNEADSMDVSNAQDRSILAYVVPISQSEVKIIVVGNGSGGILLNEDSSTMFAYLSNLKEIKGMDLLRWVNVKNSQYMFAHSGIETIDLSNATIIGYATFYECSSLISITIPNSVTSIGDFAFQNCKGLTSITIPNSVTSIGVDAFEGCSSLTSITIPNSVTTIGDYAFQNCKGLTSITIPNSVTSIGDYAFDGCTGLTSITIPDSVTSIGYDAFHGCTGLTSITLGNSVTSIGYYAFSGCSALKDVYYTGTSAEWNSITIGSSNSPLTNATKHYEYVVE